MNGHRTSHSRDERPSNRRAGWVGLRTDPSVERFEVGRDRGNPGVSADAPGGDAEGGHCGGFLATDSYPRVSLRRVCRVFGSDRLDTGRKGYALRVSKAAICFFASLREMP